MLFTPRRSVRFSTLTFVLAPITALSAASIPAAAAAAPVPILAPAPSPFFLPQPFASSLQFVILE